MLSTKCKVSRLVGCWALAKSSEVIPVIAVAGSLKYAFGVRFATNVASSFLRVSAPKSGVRGEYKFRFIGRYRQVCNVCAPNLINDRAARQYV